MSKGSPEAYQTLANIIYSEKPDLKEAMQEAARAAIIGAKASLSADITDDDLEVLFQIMAQTIASFLSAQGVDLSDRMNAAFNLYSLAAGSVAGAIDLGDATPAKDMATTIREAEEAAHSHTDPVESDPNVAGPYL